MQPYGSPWAPPPPPPPPASRFPWVAIVIVVVIVFLGLATIGAAAFVFLVARPAAVSTVTYAPPPPPPTPTPTPTLLPTPTVTAIPTTPPTVPATAVRFVPIGSSPVRGPSDALVTVVEFSDFQCPFCGRVEPTLAALRAKYGADLRIVWKNEPLPFHRRALPAAELALEARREKGDAAFWAVHDELFASQRDLDDPSLMRIARSHGVSETAATKAISTNEYQPLIDADTTLAHVLGANGTPTFFINGHLLSGAQPISKFETVIDEELKNARVMVAKGTPRARVYDAIMAGATK
jgi:protein-disulfide isomerase